MKLLRGKRASSEDARDAAQAGNLPARAPATRLEGGVLHIGRKAAAVGINWVIANDAEKPKTQAENAVIADAAPIGDRTARGNYNSFVELREEGFIGFGSKDMGHRRGMVSLVTAIPPQLAGERWIGAFRLSQHADIWWLGSMRNGQVFEDRIITGRSRAEDALREDLGAPDWTTVYAPDEWQVANSRSLELWQVIELKRARPLRDLRPIRSAAPYVILCVALLSIGIGGYSWFAKKKAEELARLEEMRRLAAAQITVEIDDYPYHAMVRLEDFVPACERAIGETIVMVAGWEMQPVSCSFGQQGNGQITAGWTRNGGKLSMLTAASPRDWPGFTISGDGEQASISLPIKAEFDAASGDDQPWEEAMIAARIRDRFQTLGIDVSIRSSPDNLDKAINAPVYNSTQVKLESQAGVGNYVDILSDVPALLPQAVIYNVASGNWDLIAKIYHPVMIPEPKPVGK